MAYVIAAPCIDVKDGDCTAVCPVDCIYQGGRMYYIQPDECIDCALCVSVCPVEAIFDADAIAAADRPFVAANREFFGPAVTGWDAPGGYAPDVVSPLDHPVVAAWPRQGG
ncbi:MAG: 4Fe-4S binding protein [Alphaproteobacteria bacterium]